MRIIIGADIVPTSSNAELFAAGDKNALIGAGLVKILNEADYRVFNLEVPLADTETPIKKNGPNLIAPTSAVKGIKNIGADLVTVANNHIMDQGDAGLHSTLKALDEDQIAYVGAGENIKEASEPYIVEKDGKKIGIYACVEHEFSVAEEAKCGANPFDPLFSYDHVSDLKKICDHVIVLYHGGKEHYRYPSPMLQRYCRRFIDKGADLVVCQHSHCIGCEEKYKSGTIVYGQGNFLSCSNDNEFWNTALIIQLDTEEKLQIEYIPIYKDGNSVRLADGEKRADILNDFYERNKEIEQSGSVEKNYREFAAIMQSDYIDRFFGNKLMTSLIKKVTGHRIRTKLSEENRLALLNRIECESHRELFLKALKEDNG